MAKRTGVAAWLSVQASSSRLVAGEDDAPVAPVKGKSHYLCDLRKRTKPGLCGSVPRLSRAAVPLGYMLLGSADAPK